MPAAKDRAGNRTDRKHFDAYKYVTTAIVNYSDVGPGALKG